MSPDSGLLRKHLNSDQQMKPETLGCLWIRVDVSVNNHKHVFSIYVFDDDEGHVDG